MDAGRPAAGLHGRTEGGRPRGSRMGSELAYVQILQGVHVAHCVLFQTLSAFCFMNPQPP